MIERYPGWLPEVSPVVASALRGIHPGLYVIRSKFALDQSDGSIIHVKGEPIERTRYYVCIDHRGNKSVLFPVESPSGEYMPCDRRVVERVGTDLGIATESIEELWSAVDAHEAKQEEQRAESERERMRRWIENNPGAWKSAIANLKNGVAAVPRQARMRDPVIYGYDGQAVRSSHHGTVPMSARDLGLDSPED